MKNYRYKGYFVMFERQHNGSILAIADNDSNRIKHVFYGYPMSHIRAEMKALINEAI